MPDKPASSEPSQTLDTGLHARTFNGWPSSRELTLDTIHYGPDIATESELRLLGGLDGKRVLELGCGGGPASVTMAKAGAKVIAVDESAEQIAQARKLCEREDVKVELHQGDLAELAYVRADSIDVALSVYAFGAVEDLNRVFRQVHRVLRPEAPLVFSVPHPIYLAVTGHGHQPIFRRRYFDRSSITWQSETEFGTDTPHTTGDLFTSLTRANFRVDTVLEPEPPATAPHTKHWTEAMRWVPSTLIIRARKQGI